MDQHSEALLQTLRASRPPFERVWLDYPQRRTGGVEVPGGSGERVIRFRDDGHPEDRTGVLVERMPHPGRVLFRLTDVGRSGGRIRPGLLSCTYDLFHPLPAWNAGDERPWLTRDRFAGSMVESVTNMLLVSAFRSLVRAYGDAPLVAGSSEKYADDPEADETRRQQFEALASRAAETWGMERALPYRALFAASEEDAKADARWLESHYFLLWPLVFCLLALLNDRRHIAVAGAAPGRPGKRIVGGKVLPWLEHHEVTLTAPREVVVGAVKRTMAEAIPKRRHEVAGHYRHLHQRWPGDPYCRHAFAGETSIREVCALCGRKRVWIADHERGDERLGRLITSYDVEREM